MEFNGNNNIMPKGLTLKTANNQVILRGNIFMFDKLNAPSMLKHIAFRDSSKEKL